MPSSKSKKTKNANSTTTRDPNQPSLFSFWGKPTKKKVGGSRTATDATTDTAGRHQDASGEAVATFTGNKRRRVETASTEAVPSSSTATAIVKAAVTPTEEKRINSNIPAVACKTNNLQRFAYQEDEASDGKENKTPELGTNDEIESPMNKKRATSPQEQNIKNNDRELTNNKKEKEKDDDTIEDISTVEPEPKASSKSDSGQEEEDDEYDNNYNNQSDDDEISEAKSLSAPPPTTDNQHNNNNQGLSDYELLRLKNIARNNARLEALGLLPHNHNHDNGKSKASKPKKRTSKRPAKMQNNHEEPVTRRSTRRTSRFSNPVVTENLDTIATHPGEQKTQSTLAMEEEETIVYEVSPVVHYEMDQSQPQQQRKPSLLSETINDKSGSTAAATLVPLGYRLAPPQGLSAIYSLQFYDTTDWIVGAGKAGIIALWNCGQPSSDQNSGKENNDDDDDDDGVTTNYVDPIVSWKGHGGRWISEAQFLMENNHDDAVTTTTPSRLVTAGNDGSVCLWDLRQVSSGTGIPKLIQQSNNSWHGKSGIFAMDVARTTTSGTVKIVTGSKDKTVALANLCSGSSSTPYWRSYIHSAKVGAVKFRDEHVLATASDDGCVAILDDRMKDGEGPPVALLENLHQRRPHSVVWQDNSSSVLLTAGLDSAIQAWDIRYLNQASPSPVMEFYGHVPTSTRRCKRIHHPVLYRHNSAGGQFVLTGGEGSHALSMFEMKHPLATSVTTIPDHTERPNLVRSAVYSRGNLPDDCCHTDIGSIAVQQDLVAATVDGEVLLLRPSF